MILQKHIRTGTGSLNALAWKKFRNNKLGFGSMIFICLVILVAILGYLITPDSTPYANDQHLELGLKKPGFSVYMAGLKEVTTGKHPGVFSTMVNGCQNEAKQTPVRSWMVRHNWFYYIEYDAVSGVSEAVRAVPLARVTLPVKTRFWFGTDRFGRDFLSQLMIGTRVSLSVGLISVVISLLIGLTLGAIAGYYRGAVDSFIVWLINVVWSIPTLLLVIAITFALGKGFWQVFIAVGLTMWVEVARVVRGQILSIREKEFVEAARALGFSDFRIIFHHILPNVMAAVIVISAANFASAILTEAGLSFLGLGVQPPVPSWGSMIKENYGYIVLDYAYLAILPGIAIMLVVLAFMLIGNALRDALDVRLSEV